jgi:phosphatidylserine decarboxylase
MAASRVNSTLLRRTWTHNPVTPIIIPKRNFASSPLHRKSKQQNESSRARLGPALGRTRIEWYWIPASAGIAFLGGVQFYKVYSRQQARKEEEDNASTYSDDERKPRKRDRIRPSGPWCVELGETLATSALTLL